MPRPKNIVFLMSDQQRLDHVSYHGRGKVQTPNMDRLAQGVGFTNCTTINPICVPTRCALLTGKYSRQVGMLAMSGCLSPQHPTYLRALQRAGYYTAGVGKFHWLQGWPFRGPRGKGHDLVALKDQIKAFGLDYAWETSGKMVALQNYCDYCQHMDRKGLLGAYREFIASEGFNYQFARETRFTGSPWPFAEEDYVDVLTGDRIVEAIRNRPKDRPLFLYGSFCCPHTPYDPPKRFLDMVPYEEVDDFIVGPPGAPGAGVLPDEVKKRLYRLRRAYKAMVLLVDAQIGRVMRTLEEEGMLNDTVVLFTSDHGEMNGDRGRMQKSQPYWQTLSVPCAIWHPDHLDRRLNTAPVEITDLTATILDIAGLDAQKELAQPWPTFGDRVPCRSLLPIVIGNAERIRDYSFAECSNVWQLIQTERWKYIRNLNYAEPGQRPEEFYDREADPDEVHNIAADPGVRAELDLCRVRCDYVLDHTPPAQLTWAPIIK